MGTIYFAHECVYTTGQWSCGFILYHDAWHGLALIAGLSRCGLDYVES